MYLRIKNRYHSGSQGCQQGAKLIVEIRDKEVRTTHWESVIALVLVIPIILFPAAFVWFLNVSGTYTVICERRKRQVAREKGMRIADEVK